MICGVPFKWNTLTPIMQRLDTGVNKFPRLVRFMITRSFTIHYSESNGRGVVAIQQPSSSFELQRLFGRCNKALSIGCLPSKSKHTLQQSYREPFIKPYHEMCLFEQNQHQHSSNNKPCSHINCNHWIFKFCLYGSSMPS